MFSFLTAIEHELQPLVTSFTDPSGKSYPEREVYPSASQWGHKGWTLYTEAGALEKMRWLHDPYTEDRTDDVERETWKKLHPGRERT